MGINLVGTEEIENPRVHENEIINGSITGGWMVERGICDIKDAANKLLKMYNSPEMLKTMGENGRKAVLKEYDWKVIMPQWQETVEELTKLV